MSSYIARKRISWDLQGRMGLCGKIYWWRKIKGFPSWLVNVPSPSLSSQKRANLIFSRASLKATAQSFCSISRYSHTSVLVCFRTHQTLHSLHFDKRKMFQHSALTGDSLHLLQLVCHFAAPQEHVFHHSVFFSFGTCHDFQNKLTTSTEVPLKIQSGTWLV